MGIGDHVQEGRVNNWLNRCHFGDCRDTIREMIADGVRVNCIITSPPYFALRDYGVDGQLGLEKTVDEYIVNMVDVFQLCRQLLADDGTLWLNLGDTFSGAKKGRNADGLPNDTIYNAKQGTNRGSSTGKILTVTDTVPTKNLYGVPWRVAFALQADGWILRQDIIWAKPNPMPESVKDRCTKSHEYLFLLAKNKHYFFDIDAIKEDAVTNENRDAGVVRNRTLGYDSKENLNPDAYRKSYRNSFNRQTKEAVPPNKQRQHRAEREHVEYSTSRNKRSIWTISTQPYTGAHFATFPEALVEPCVLAGSRTGDIVFDPFFGSGTVGKVAQRLGRHWIGCELNNDYAPLQAERTAQAALILETI